MRDAAVFWLKVFFLMFVLLFVFFSLFIVDLNYVISFLGIAVLFFIVRLVVVIVQTNNRCNRKRKIEQEKERVKYVIIK